MLAPHEMSAVAFSNFDEKLFPRECATSQRTAGTEHCSNLEVVLKMSRVGPSRDVVAPGIFEGP